MTKMTTEEISLIFLLRKALSFFEPFPLAGPPRLGYAMDQADDYLEKKAQEGYLIPTDVN